MKTLYRKKAIALYETRLRVGFVVTTLVLYLVASVLWFLLAVILPYADTVTVSERDNVIITRAALSATAEQQAADERDKERALLLPSSASSFARRLRLIEDAKKSVDFMVYDVRKQDYAFYFFTALVRAADRGVKVRIVLDGKFGRLNGKLSALGKIVSSHDNIELYYFNEANILDPGGLMTLMHDKVTIVDGETVIVGGVNMGSSWYLDNFDMEVMITNSGEFGASGQATRYFEHVITDNLSRRIKSKKFAENKKAEYEKQFKEFYAKSEFANAEVDYSKQGTAVDRVTFVSNKISDKKKSPIVWQAVCNLMRNAETSTIVTPYALLQNDKKQEIREIAQTNKSFKIITNSLYNTRNVAYADYYYSRADYINNSITLLEYMTDDQTHAKLFSVDNRYSVIGSFNLDERSAHIDTESVVVIDGEAFNGVLNDYIETQFVSNSVEVGADNEYIPSDTVTARYADGFKKFKYAFLSALGLIRCLI
ncbi:MAG: hypothetical protein HDT28_08730 [Clostridiales bacterium]|nr:hypothetical protein [Clostridiales bacterium]